MNREAGKGDKQRPTNKEAYDKNYDSIFGKKDTVSEYLKEVDNDIEADKIVHKLQTGYATEADYTRAKLDEFRREMQDVMLQQLALVKQHLYKEYE